MNKTFVIVPVFNEDKEVVYDTIVNLLEKFEHVVVVNDGGDISLLKELELLSVYYLRHDTNLGQGASLQTGMEYAIEQGADIIAHFDADGQHHVNDLINMIEFLRNTNLDIVLGSRFLMKKHRNGIPFSRKVVLKIATFINFIFTGLLLSDAHHGLRVLSRSAANQIQLKENRQLHATEMIWLIRKLKLKFCEFPAQVSYSSYSLRKGQKNIHSVRIFTNLVLSKLIR